MTKEKLIHDPKSCWERFTSRHHGKAMDELAARYVDFLSACKTERETVSYVVKKLEDAGYAPDFHSKKTFRVFKGKTIFMARKGRRPLSEGFRLVGAHADTPRLDFKQHPLYQDCELALAKTHYYGGIRKYQWLACPLAIHGVVITKDGETKTVTIGEDPSDPVLTITDLLPHLAYKQVVQKVSDAFEAEKLNIVMGHQPSDEKGKKGKNDKPKDPIKLKVLELLNKKYGIVEEDLYSAELQAVPAGPARMVGLDSSLVGGYGQDDRSCVFTALEALLASKTPEHAQVVIFWDKEEIGSDGSTGAQSKFLEYCLEDLLGAWDPETKLSTAFLAAKAISADVHAGLDPDHQDVYEKLNAAKMGYGPCFSKFTGHRGKIAANDAHPEYIAFLRQVLDSAEVPWQMAEMGKVDAGGGGTVAKHLAIYGLDIIDMGPPVLSMHSPFELTSKPDLYATKLAFKAFLES